MLELNLNINYNIQNRDCSAKMSIHFMANRLHEQILLILSYNENIQERKRLEIKIKQKN